jgi:hypothetical protein
MSRFYYGLPTPTQYVPPGGFIEGMFGGWRPGDGPLLRRSKTP